ncbi:hypothetical protein SDC9_130505 [bioreactor metagenome]|uniref:Uncharacterized protein n=1 Tax=bioreactor metagenome TaxID=1076179 RepID=A0A645D2R2_9ZZZZ
MINKRSVTPISLPALGKSLLLVPALKGIWMENKSKISLIIIFVGLVLNRITRIINKIFDAGIHCGNDIVYVLTNI